MEFNRHDRFIKIKENGIADEAFIKIRSGPLNPSKIVKKWLFFIQVKQIQLTCN